MKFKFDGVIDMKIREVNENKKQFIALLLLADEQENMIDHYLEKGTMYVLEDGNVKAECVVTDEDNGILEIKNIAVDPQNQGQGYGKALIGCAISLNSPFGVFLLGIAMNNPFWLSITLISCTANSLSNVTEATAFILFSEFTFLKRTSVICILVHRPSLSFNICTY